jgi:hypothetical protein
MMCCLAKTLTVWADLLLTGANRVTNEEETTMHSLQAQRVMQTPTMKEAAIRRLMKIAMKHP